MNQHPTANFLDINFTVTSYDQAAADILAMSERGRFSYVVTPNVDHITMLNPRHPNSTTYAFRRAYCAAAMRLCDSRVVQKLARLRSIELSVVTGSDLVAHLFHNKLLQGRKIAIIGGDTSTVCDLNSAFPDITIIQHCPPMGVLKSADATRKVVDFVIAQAADIVFFALGAPQSEIIAYRCSVESRCRGVAICVGASIEFLLGRKQRAPRWIQQLSLEWAFRLLKEPRRLWRRYLWTGPRVFQLAASWRLQDISSSEPGGKRAQFD